MKIVNGTYGSSNTPSQIFVYPTRRGNWYCVDGSTNVNLTHDDITEETNVEELNDIDTFTWSDPIESIEDLETAVDY